MQELLEIGFMYIKVLILAGAPFMGVIIGMWYIVKWCQKHVKSVMLQWGYPIAIALILATPLMIAWFYIIVEKGWIYVY